ncbi:hypothetical protein ACFL5H_02965 [Candidatus Latescibacterota bacterium]
MRKETPCFYEKLDIPLPAGVFLLYFLTAISCPPFEQLSRRTTPSAVHEDSFF